ncbi:citramalate synthase [Propionivibrio sp.]|uniref:citramalate synthase n=2 Tax=Propionivibrio sp. TaxID=2212460 RepID=UPI0034552E35|nr:citramalate synthase [Propionivibrio sp.]MBK8401789.1 citramalate synthase [Propionivibrio sp.]MBK8744513.1 citramalate synthase [Propionivibrio sp.]MBK8894981.1 citramalate synthase [Propionivibrio sp.]MBL0208256.1 citramalate synthase [Propionivibrio sp.]
MGMKVSILDSTLRDGAQAEGISFSVEDKLKILELLDDHGVDYIEAGNPGSNPKDLEFFARAKGIVLKHARLAAFGSTRRRDCSAESDDNVQSLLQADTPVIVIFGKSWDFHVTEIIRTSLQENLNMISDTVAFFKGRGKEVVYDAEHFFDGYKNNPEYAVESLRAAVAGGADALVLCDTNGGTFPSEVAQIVRTVEASFAVPLGIHAHNDCGMAVANSVMAVENGARHVQGTYIGFGERCGNANLSTIIANLGVKREFECLPDGQYRNITRVARHIAAISNVALNERDPFVGNCAFAHKGGMHIDGVNKAAHSFEHIDPDLVGGQRRFLMSEVSGRRMILEKIWEVDASISKDDAVTDSIIKRLKEMEHEGYQFEGAESTFELVIRKQLGKYRPFFELEHFKIIGEQPTNGAYGSSAIIKVKVDGTDEITAAEGDGPVHALDCALRRALDKFYPELSNVHLTDYKVRVINGKDATAAKVRVLLQSTDGDAVWTTVGVSTDIIEASWIALVDSIEYKLLKLEEAKCPK